MVDFDFISYSEKKVFQQMAQGGALEEIECSP